MYLKERLVLVVFDDPLFYSQIVCSSSTVGACGCEKSRRNPRMLHCRTRLQRRCDEAAEPSPPGRSGRLRSPGDFRLARSTSWRDLARTNSDANLMPRPSGAFELVKGCRQGGWTGVGDLDWKVLWNCRNCLGGMEMKFMAHFANGRRERSGQAGG